MDVCRTAGLTNLGADDARQLTLGARALHPRTSPSTMKHIGKNAVIVGSPSSPRGSSSAWLRFRPYLGSEGRYTDGFRTYDVEEEQEVRYAVWEDPELLAEATGGADTEDGPALSPDGRFLVFAVGEPGLGADLWNRRDARR